MTEIITFLITICSFVVGYFIGRREKLEAPVIAEAIKKRIKMSKIKPGPLMRPSLDKLERKQNKKLYEGIDETKRAFDELGVKNG